MRKKHIILKNPIPESFKDSKKISQFFEQFGSGKNRIIMPMFYDNVQSAHSFTKTVKDLYDNSPSAQACANWLIKMAFGGEMGSVDVVKSTKAGRVSGEDKGSLSEAENAAFDKWFEDLGLNFMDFSRLTCELEKNNYIPSGNAYLRIRLAEVNGQWSCTFKVESFLTTAAFARANNNSRKLIATVDNWDYEQGKKIGVCTASEIGKDFDWIKRGDGIFETIVHFKNVDSFSYYGRSKLLTIINQMYAEYEKGNQSAKIERVATISKYLLETPEETVELTKDCDDSCEKCSGRGCLQQEINNRETSLADSLRCISTNEGDEPHDIIVDFYDKENGGTSTLHKFDVLRDSMWLEKSSRELRNIIHSTGFNIPAELTKMDKLTGGLNSEQLLIMLVVTNEETVAPTRQRWHNNWSHILSEIAKQTGRNDMTRYGIEFEDKISNVIDLLKDLKHGEKTNITDRT